jgi:transposase
MADRAYAVQSFIDWLIERQIMPVIPPYQRANVLREYDEWLYQERYLIECLVIKYKHFRRVFSGFDKLTSRYLGFLHLVGALIWLRSYVNTTWFSGYMSFVVHCFWGYARVLL